MGLPGRGPRLLAALPQKPLRNEDGSSGSVFFLRTARRSRIYVMRGIVFAYCQLTRGRESMMMSYIAFLVTSDERAYPLGSLGSIYTRLCRLLPRSRRNF